MANKTVRVNPLDPTASDSIYGVLDNYYKEVNRQLDKRLNRERDPFKNPLAPQDQYSAPITPNPNAPKPSTFIPRGTLNPQNPGHLPFMEFKGIIEAEGNRAALLKIHKLGTFVVRVGDKVGLQQVVSTGAVLHILEINELNLIVETGTYGEQMVVQ